MFDNPIIENYITQYMEETQDSINNSITFDQFKCIEWSIGIPNFVIDLMILLTGCPQEIKDVYNQLRPFLLKISEEDTVNQIQ